MERATVDIYEARGGEWAAQRLPVHRAEARAFAGRVGDGAPRVDLGAALEHVRRLLAPGGLLLLVEGLRPQAWLDLTFGLLYYLWNRRKPTGNAVAAIEPAHDVAGVAVADSPSAPAPAGVGTALVAVLVVG